MSENRLPPNALLIGGLSLLGLVIIYFTVGSRFFKDEPPPPPPPPPPPAESTVTQQLRYSPVYYRALTDDDAKKFGIPTPAIEFLQQPLAYRNELKAPFVLSDKGTSETESIELRTHVINEWATTATGQSFKYQHLVMDIRNKTDKYLAYHVDTAVASPEKCKHKGAIAHDALALKPGETLSRTECLWRPHIEVEVDRVEVLELTPIGYFYVSKVDPTQMGLEERTAAGHDPPSGKICAFIPRREIELSMEKLSTSWSDVIDFYARHNCEEYSFLRGYHRPTQKIDLPVKPRAAEPETAAPSSNASPHD